MMHEAEIIILTSLAMQADHTTYNPSWNYGLLSLLFVSFWTGDMGSFPRQFFSILVASLSFSAIGIAFAALSLTISPVAWFITVIVIITFTHHTYILLHGRSDSYNTPHIYSKTLIRCAYFLAFLWIAALAATGAITYLLISGIMRSADDEAKIWMSILSGVSLLEVLLLSFMANQCRKEMKEIQYRNKWKWRVDVYTRGLPTQRSLVKSIA